MFSLERVGQCYKVLSHDVAQMINGFTYWWSLGRDSKGNRNGVLKKSLAAFLSKKRNTEWIKPLSFTLRYLLPKCHVPFTSDPTSDSTGLQPAIVTIYKQNKLTRNKNARHIFPRHFLTVAMIGIICLYMRFVLYIFHTRSLFFKYQHYFRSYDNHCTKCTCTSCTPTTRLFAAKICF